MSVNRKDGSSVYLVNDNRIFNPQYVAARETIKKYSKKKYIVELGGGPMHSSGVLANSGYRVVDVDLDDTLLDFVKKTYPGVETIKADLENGLPETLDVDGADVFVALDFLEHISYENCLKLLREIKEKKKGKPFILVTIFPTVDWLKVPTWFDWVRRLTDPVNVKKGLFDPTHKFQLNQKGQKKLFERAGYRVLEEYPTNAIDAITGKWRELDLSKVSWMKNPIPWVENSKKVGKIIGYVFHPFDKEKRDKLIRQVLIQRVFYVLRPD